MVLHSFNWPHGGHDVKVTGDFDNWSATINMQRTEEGLWVKVIDLPANTKVYYKFVVDGAWRADGAASTEGSGAHENNYIVTDAPYAVTAALPQDRNNDDLPVLGHGASYVSSKPPTSSLDESASRNDPSAKSNQGGGRGLVGPDRHSEDVTTSSVPTKTDNPLTTNESTSRPVANSDAQIDPVTSGVYDDSGPSPSNPIAVLNGQPHPVSETYSSVVSSLPSADELKHEVEHVAEVAGGFLAAGLAAGAAMFGLSNHSAHSEASPITGHTASTANTEALPSQSREHESSQSHTSETTQTATLEQKAVAAATSAATNAYHASGLSGLTGLGSPVSSLSRDGDVGYTSIGTAVNEETGVVGTSKIVQGINDVNTTEDTQTARLASTTASGLLENHENGAKVQRLGEHAVLAEVGIGGAAIGTAIVTDSTIMSSKELDVPSQAAEHLDDGPTASEPAKESDLPQESSNKQELDVRSEAAEQFDDGLANSKKMNETGLAQVVSGEQEPEVPSHTTEHSNDDLTASKSVDLDNGLTAGKSSSIDDFLTGSKTTNETVLPQGSIGESTTGATSSTQTARLVAIHADSGLAPALRRGVVEPVAAANVVTSGNLRDVNPTTVSSEKAIPVMPVASATVEETSTPFVQSTTQTTTTGLKPVQLSTGSDKDVTRKHKTQLSSDSTKTRSKTTGPVQGTKTSTIATPISPSKAAAQAAASNSAKMRQTLRPEQPQAPSTATAAAAAAESSTGDGSKKKKPNILRKMKNMFGGSRDKM